MKNTIKFALLPCVAILTLAAPPAQAVTVSSSAPTATSLSAGSSSSSTASAKQVKQQLKREAKLRKKCAKLASGNIKAKKRAKLMSMCRSATGEEAAKPSTSNAGGNSADNTGGGSSNSNAGGGSSNSNAGGNSANSNAGGGSSSNNAGGSNPIVDLINQSPPLFVPAAETLEGDSETPLALVPPDTRAVPEPGSLALLGLGLLGLGFARRRVNK